MTVSSAFLPNQTSGRTSHTSHTSGATALGALGDRGGHPHHRHRLGDAVRAVSVFLGTALEVAVLGDYAEVREEERHEEERREKARRRTA
ncbi:hypothetical protein GCM10010420_06440 [Streptomyces glaucosporus]|uniref:Uncharacterized protein n=1 Tax=Streptomyces glaucosporus TaxID=284044 RepID=A0ABN3HSC5_9ACTN